MQLYLDLSDLIHRQIVLEMTLKTLDHDHKQIPNLKMHAAFDAWYLMQIKKVTSEIIAVKGELGRQGCKIKSSTKNGDFIDYLIIAKGAEFTKQYHAISLKNWCVEETKKRLNIASG